MSVRQATGAHAVSLPNGCRSLPLEVLPLLERFERLYLWMDDDGPGEGSECCDGGIGEGADDGETYGDSALSRA
jgi:hypothetical protein